MQYRFQHFVYVHVLATLETVRVRVIVHEQRYHNKHPYLFAPDFRPSHARV